MPLAWGDAGWESPQWGSLAGVLLGGSLLWLLFGAGGWEGEGPCPGHGVMEQGRPWRGGNAGGLVLAVWQSTTLSV